MKKASKTKKKTIPWRSLPTDLISSGEAASIIGLAPKTLSNWRTMQRRDQPPYYKLPAVRYSRAAVLEWFANRKVGVHFESQAS